jgi:serine/threonine-protein kinase
MKKPGGAETRAAGAAGPFDAGGWARLVALSALSALWSLFLWMELVLLRSGGQSFCATGGSFDCSTIWNGAFSSAVQRLTGLPIAGWGLAWSVVAFALPLTGLLRRAQGRAAPEVLSATRLTAAAGVLVIVVMIAASLIEGAVCIGCVGTYLLVAVYAVVALSRWRSAGLPNGPKAAVLAGGTALAAYLVLLYPGLRTPRMSGEAGRRAVEAVAPGGPASASGSPAAARGTGDPQRDKALSDLVASLDPSLKQTMADSLAIYRAAVPQQLPAPRALNGSDLAPVRITEFTDILCEHCAALNETLHTLREHVAPGSFSVDARQFPLDGRCNSLTGPREGDDVRCVAAKLLICAEPAGKEPELATALFDKQQGLTGNKAMQIASGFLPRERIGPCLGSPATEAALAQDIAAAAHFDSDGTPIVAVNGRKATSFAPFLYAMVLTRGNPDHPAFATLPPGDPGAHLH